MRNGNDAEGVKVDAPGWRSRKRASTKGTAGAMGAECTAASMSWWRRGVGGGGVGDVGWWR